MDDKMDLIANVVFRIVQNHGEWSYFLRFSLGGRLAQSPL